MLNPRLASRYAKSLIDLAQEQDQLERIYTDVVFLQGIIKNNKELGVLLRSPIVSADKKNKIIDAVTAGKIAPLMTAFNKLLISKGRESTLPEILTSFIQQYKSFKKIHTIQLTTATPISDELRNSIMAQIRNTSNIDNIELETIIDESLIGGFVLQAGDKLIDASIAYDLKEVARQFENNDFIYNIK